MIEYKDALDIAKKHLSINETSKNVILEENTIEKEFGWVFFYQSRKFLETGDYRFYLLGNSPLIINRNNGEVHVTGTARSAEYYINEYENTHS